MAFVLDTLEVPDMLDLPFGSIDVACAWKVVCGTSLGRATGASHTPQVMAREHIALFKWVSYCRRERGCTSRWHLRQQSL